MMKNLDPHSEAKPALEKLQEAGFRIVALTNGGGKTVEKQLKNAGISHFFDKKYSVEAVQKFKPHPDSYRYVLDQEKTSPASAMMISAPGWDILGASRTGLQTTFISRPGKFPYPHQEADYTARDLLKLAEILLEP